MQQYNEYQTLHYKAKYRPKPDTKVKTDFWTLTYNGKVLTNPMPYSGCQVSLKMFRQMGCYPDKSKFVIKPYKI